MKRAEFPDACNTARLLLPGQAKKRPVNSSGCPIPVSSDVYSFDGNVQDEPIAGFEHRDGFFGGHGLVLDLRRCVD